MDKAEILKVFYKQQIATLAERCADSDLLELIYKLLLNEATPTPTAHTLTKN